MDTITELQDKIVDNNYQIEKLKTENESQIAIGKLKNQRYI